MKRIHVFTSAACNYIPKVRVLVESVRQYHPEWMIHLALADELPDGVDLSGEAFDEIHPLSSLEIPNCKGWAFCHSLVELATAIKPVMLRHLLGRDDCSGVIYLDPDIVLFSPLDEVVRLIGEANIALTPHQITPESTLGAVMDNEICSLKHGIYNLGFLAVAPTETGKAFSDWWSDRTYHFCRDEIHHGLFTDQRWIDLVPAFFEGVCILRSARFNVAPWNLTTRQIEGTLSKGFTVNGEPLGFYHFTGFDSGAHHIMARINGSQSSAVQPLIDWYDQKTSRLSEDALSSQPWTYGAFDDGIPIPSGARLVYRERIDLQAAFPEPFLSGGQSFQSWYFSQGRLEYPDLFDASTERAGMEKLAQNLSPGYQAGMTNPMSSARIAAKLAQIAHNPKRLVPVVRKSFEILRCEGFRGLVRRLQ